LGNRGPGCHSEEQGDEESHFIRRIGMKKFLTPLTLVLMIFFLTDDDFEGVDFDDSWGLNAKIGHHLHELLDIEFNFDYLDKFEGDAGVDVEVMTYILGLKGFFPIASEKVKLSVVAGGGLMNADADSDNEIDGCAKFGLGFDYFIIQNFSAGIEGNYTLGFGDLDEIRYFNFTLGVAYHF
jgi:hypothetical protein